MMKRSVVGVLVAVAMVGCGPKPAESINFGVVISTTGGYGALGGERSQGVQLAVAEINAKGGVLGKQLSFTAKDDATTRANAKTIVEGFVADGLQVIIGPSFSGGSLEVLTVTGPARVLQLSGSATSPALTTAEDLGQFFRTCAPDTAQAAVLARKADDGALRRVAMFTDSGDGKAYSEGIANEFKRAFEARAATNSVVTTVTLTAGQTTYKPQLDALFAGNPTLQAVLLPLYSAQSAVVIADYQKNQSSYPAVTFLLTDSSAEADFVAGVATAGGSFTNVAHYGTGPGASASRYAGFVERYKARFGSEPEETSFAANYYDATYLMALAAEAAGEFTGEALAAKYVAVSTGGALVSADDFTAAAADAKAGKDIDYDGVSGPVDLGAVGEPAVAPYNIWSVVSGKVTSVERGVLP